jgi:hypothetical protein
MTKKSQKKAKRKSLMDEKAIRKWIARQREALILKNSDCLPPDTYPRKIRIQACDPDSQWFLTPSGLPCCRKKTQEEQERQNQLKCYCENLHPTAFQKLQELTRTTDLSKRQVCEDFAKKWNVHFDSPIADDIIGWIDEFTPAEWEKMTQGKSPLVSPKTCSSYLKEEPRGTPLIQYVDPIEQAALRDFVRIPHLHPKMQEVLYNWNTIQGLRGGKHPLSGEILSKADLAQVASDEKEKKRRLHSIWKDWGIVYQPKTEEVDKKTILSLWESKQRFSPPRFQLRSRSRSPSATSLRSISRSRSRSRSRPRSPPSEAEEEEEFVFIASPQQWEFAPEYFWRGNLMTSLRNEFRRSYTIGFPYAEGWSGRSLGIVAPQLPSDGENVVFWIQEDEKKHMLNGDVPLNSIYQRVQRAHVIFWQYPPLNDRPIGFTIEITSSPPRLSLDVLYAFPSNYRLLDVAEDVKKLVRPLTSDPHTKIVFYGRRRENNPDMLEQPVNLSRVDPLSGFLTTYHKWLHVKLVSPEHVHLFASTPVTSLD